MNKINHLQLLGTVPQKRQNRNENKRVELVGKIITGKHNSEETKKAFDQI